MQASPTPARARIAVVDDEPLLLEAWQELLASEYEVKLFSDPIAAARHFETNDVDVTLLDLRMPGMDGLALLARLKQAQPNAEAIIVTGHGSIQTAVQAVQMGAYDFLCKPIEDLDSARHRIETALERKRLKELNSSLKARLAAHMPENEILGESRAIRKVQELIDQVADSAAPVMLCGESGTGKELVARALHAHSRRAPKPFVAINCAAIPDTLIDSEMFGHERGAFTGAVSTHKGLFEAADGGTLFLDEIGDVPLQTQVRLLRALQEGEIRAVGATRSRPVNVRVVVATNADLDRAMRQGRFREDFYYRLSTFRIELPPLRERREDIAVLAQHLLEKVARRSGREVKGFADTALAALIAHDWPGNVRELANAIEHAAVLCTTGSIELTHLPPFVTARAMRRPRPNEAEAPGSASSVPFTTARNQLLEAFEQRYLTDLLSLTQGNLSEAARRSKLDRANLRRRLNRHRINPASFKVGEATTPVDDE